MISAKHSAAIRENQKKSVEANRKPKVQKVCQCCSIIFGIRPSADKMGAGKFCSNACRYKFKRGPNGANAGNHLGIAASKNPNWKGGISGERKAKHRDAEVGVWRRAVYYKDNYICVRCGHIGKELRAHHKASWAKFPELRFDVSNGVTLCAACHLWVHSRANVDREYIL